MTGRNPAHRPLPTVVAALSASLVLLTVLAGCGEKIAIPEPVGLFSVNAYYQSGEFEDPNVRRLAVVNGLLYVLGSDGSLVKRNQNYEERERYDGLVNPTALCGDDDSEMIFVWEEGTGRLSFFAAADLVHLGSTELPDVQTATRLAACRTGMETVAAGAHTLVYLADPDSGVVHRYAYFDGGTLEPMGILCRSDGLSVRFVNEPAGMLRDNEDRLWVCDADTNRNWAIRFDPTPDLTDVADEEDAQHPWRGRAELIDAATCVPPTEADYVLGDARECGETWTGGPSSEPGAFHRPLALATDGLGRIFVADSVNDRVQIFSASGVYELQFGDAVKTPASIDIGVVDVTIGAGEYNFGAYIFLVSDTSGKIHKFISYDQYTHENQEPPPPN